MRFAPLGWIVLAAAVALVSCSTNGGQRPELTARTSARLSGGQDVIWTGLVNATATGNDIQKTGGQPETEDAGGVSQQQVASGDGAFEFTQSETNTYKFVGFGHTNAWGGAATIDFSFRMQSGRADIYENNTWVADNLASTGDVLDITVTSGVVTYSKNGSVIYTSTKAPTYPLIVQADFIDSGATINGAEISGGSQCTTPAAFASNINVGGITSSGATVTWSTPVSSTSVVNYGTTSSYGSTTSTSGSATTHSVALSGLTAATVYHYQVQSADGSGSTVTSADRTFTTASGSGSSQHAFCGWMLANGYVDISQDPGYNTFAANASYFDAIHPIWWHVASTTALATVYGNGASQVLNNTTYSGKRTKLIPTIAAVDNGDPNNVHTIINSPSLTTQHINLLLTTAQNNHYDGVDLDYEHLPSGDQAAYSSFISQLATAFHNAGKTVSLAVDALTAADSSAEWDYTALTASGAADQLHVMGYDYHYLGSHPGPISPLAWIQSAVSYMGTINGGGAKGKFILGLANYSLAGSDQGVTDWSGTSMDAINLCAGNYTTTDQHMATATSCPFTNGVYVNPGLAPNAQTSNGHLYFEDLSSMSQKVQAAKNGGLGGITYFTVGGEPDRPGSQTFFQMVRSQYPQQ